MKKYEKDLSLIKQLYKSKKPNEGYLSYIVANILFN